MKKLTTIRFGAAVLSAFALLALAGATEDGVEKLVGKPLDKIEMTTVEGKLLTNKDFKGKVVLFDFWATWCGPCKKASPIMDKLYKEFKDKGLLVIGANTFEEDGKKMAIAYRDEHKYSYTMTYDNDKLAERWGIQGIPTFVLVDTNGKVVKAFSGFAPQIEGEFRAEIKKLLEK